MYPDEERAGDMVRGVKHVQELVDVRLLDTFHEECNEAFNEVGRRMKPLHSNYHFHRCRHHFRHYYFYHHHHHRHHHRHLALLIIM